MLRLGIASSLLIMLGAASLAPAGGYYGSSYANDYTNGFVDGYYTYRDGYWWYAGCAYTRVKVWDPQSYYYDACGRAYPYARTWHWEYSQVASAPTYTTPAYTPAVSSSDPHWKGKLLDIAAARDRGEIELRKTSVDHAAFLQSVQALGLQGNFAIQGYGQALLYPGFALPGFAHGTAAYGNANLGTFGANADALYGYSYNQLREAYGELNMNTLYQQAARNTQTAQALGGQAHTEFSGLVGQAGDNQARIAEILAKAQAAKIALDAANPQASSKTQTSTTIVGSTPAAPATGVAAAAATAGDDGALFMRNVVSPRCLACHSGGNLKGGLDLTGYLSFPPEKKDLVRERVYASDPARRMPRGKDGGPGPALPAEEKAGFATH
jgi:hypothetical protein